MSDPMIARLFAWLLGCRHAHRGFAFRARTEAHVAESLQLGVDYQRCMDCGRAILAGVQLEPDPRFRSPEPRRATDAEITLHLAYFCSWFLRDNNYGRPTYCLHEIKSWRDPVCVGHCRKSREWLPLTDPSDCAMVMEALREQGYAWAIGSNKDGTDAELLRVEDGYMHTWSVHTEPTWLRALCLAAFRATGGAA